MLQRGEVTVTNVMPFITILRQLGTVALRGREGGREGGKKGRRERGRQGEEECKFLHWYTSHLSLLTVGTLTALNTVRLRAKISAFGRAL